MGWFSIAKAILTRLLFVVHILITTWRVTDVLQNNIYWLLVLGLVLLFLEAMVTLIKRGGEDWKWICPSFLIFLMSSVPGIWFLEMNRLDRYALLGKENATAADAVEKLSTIYGVSIPLRLSSDMWVLVLEQSLLFLLIIGRWMLPKGELTRDQLSQLLFVYIGMASDIMELFVLFDEEKVLGDPLLAYVILAVWSVSLLQYGLVLTATKSRKPRMATHARDADMSATEKASRQCLCCETEIWAILTTVLMQDGPFMGLRLYILISKNVMAYGMLFFTFKNALVLSLQFYRIVVITCESKDDDEDDDKALIIRNAEEGRGKSSGSVRHGSALSIVRSKHSATVAPAPYPSDNHPVHGKNTSEC